MADPRVPKQLDIKERRSVQTQDAGYGRLLFSHWDWNSALSSIRST